MKHAASGVKSKWTSELSYQIDCDLENSWLPKKIANSPHAVLLKMIYRWAYDGVINIFKQCLNTKGKDKRNNGNCGGK